MSAAKAKTTQSTVRAAMEVVPGERKEAAVSCDPFRSGPLQGKATAPYTTIIGAVEITQRAAGRSHKGQPGKASSGRGQSNQSTKGIGANMIAA